MLHVVRNVEESSDFMVKRQSHTKETKTARPNRPAIPLEKSKRGQKSFDGCNKKHQSSQRRNNVPWKVYLAIEEKSGAIKNAYCRPACLAGQV